MTIDIRTFSVINHIEQFFGCPGIITVPERQRFSALADDLRIVELDRGSSFVYASAGVCTARNRARAAHEFVLQAPRADRLAREALVLACYWQLSTDEGAHVGDTLNVEAPWFTGSSMTRLLVSLPYPYGPPFEVVQLDGGDCSFRWLMPVHDAEAAAVKHRGLDAVEAEFERRQVAVDDPQRASVF
jgi:Suppressor of fused protein (SUFU)